jgi:hypothetical protein
VSVKDRWIGPREQVLNELITCWCYGPNKPSSHPSTKGWFCPHCFNGCIGRETGYGTMDQSVIILWIGLVALFSWEQWLCSTLLMTMWKVAICTPCEICMVEGHMWIEHGKCVACWSFSPCRVYIDSNHRDPRIWVPLICNSHHIDNLMNLMEECLCYFNIITWLQLLDDPHRLHLSFIMVWIELKHESKTHSLRGFGTVSLFCRNGFVTLQPKLL